MATELQLYGKWVEWSEPNHGPEGHKVYMLNMLTMYFTNTTESSLSNIFTMNIIIYEVLKKVHRLKLVHPVKEEKMKTGNGHIHQNDDWSIGKSWCVFLIY